MLTVAIRSLYIGSIFQIVKWEMFNVALARLIQPSLKELLWILYGRVNRWSDNTWRDSYHLSVIRSQLFALSHRTAPLPFKLLSVVLQDTRFEWTRCDILIVYFAPKTKSGVFSPKDFLCPRAGQNPFARGTNAILQLVPLHNNIIIEYNMKMEKENLL